MKIVILIVLIGVVGAFLGYQFIYNKAHPDYKNEIAFYTLGAEDLFDEYVNDNAAANEKYTGTMIQVNGKLDKVEVSDSITVAVFAFSEGLFGDEGVRCRMLPEYNEEMQSLNPSKQVLIKGLCVGYNDTDVVMEHCSLK